MFLLIPSIFHVMQVTFRFLDEESLVGTKVSEVAVDVDPIASTIKVELSCPGSLKTADLKFHQLHHPERFHLHQ